MSEQPADPTIAELKRDLAAAQSEIRLLRRRLGEAQKTADRTESDLRQKLRNAVPRRQSPAVAQAEMQLGRRLDLWRSPVVVAVIGIVFVALVLDAGVGWYQGHSLAARRLARLQLENMALQSLYVELKRVAYEPDGKSYRMTIAMQNADPQVPLYVMLNPVGVYVQVGMSWQQVPSGPAGGVAWGVVKVVDSYTYDVLFTPEVTGWAELIPGYMHVRIQDDMLVSPSAQPKEDVVERRTPFYVYLKPHRARDDDIKARSKMSGVPPVFIPMPPH
jgi:hypothetical protein